MPISATDKLGIADLLITEEQNIPTLLQVAKSVTKNVCDIATAQEALDYLCLHIDDTATLLHKRLITKEILFKYLHRRNVSIAADFTKTALVLKVVEYWRSSVVDANTAIESSSEVTDNTYTANYRLNGALMSDSLSLPTDLCTASNYEQPLPPAMQPTTEPSQYPIHLLARKFSEWFFENYNTGSLKLEDFWSDAHLMLRIVASDQVVDNECQYADDVITCLMHSKQQFGFYFNPNLTHAGVQGRMDVHGLVLVLVCGTLHTQQNCVGVFECTFGLLRDPFAENNWKIKTIQCLLRSQGATHVPSLYESDTLKESLSLPVPMGELT